MTCSQLGSEAAEAPPALGCSTPRGGRLWAGGTDRLEVDLICLRRGGDSRKRRPEGLRERTRFRLLGVGEPWGGGAWSGEGVVSGGRGQGEGVVRGRGLVRAWSE